MPLRAVSEFDLRVYLDDVLNQDDFRTAKPAAALLASLGRFFAYLAARTSAPISCPWAESVLDELAAFDQRRRGISELFFHGGSVAHCRQAMYDALTARLLVANILVSDSDLVTAWAGPFEREVEYQVQRLWLVWRDEIVRSETTRRDAVLRALCERQARWEATPNPSVNGRTPREVIEAERRVFTPELPMARPLRAPKSHR